MKEAAFTRRVKQGSESATGKVTETAMYVCLCNAVRESDIHAAVENGVRDMRELIMATGCSSSCKKCARTAAEVLEEALQGRQPFLRVVASGQAA